MKKIFTLFFALFTLAFFANAQQVTVILEAHDVWQDGSGYQLLLDADHNTYGTVIPATGPLSTSGDVPASVYAEFEYTVPANADGSLTTTNMVNDGSVTITIPAGTYDFCVTNPTPGACMWIAGGENSRQDDYVFSDAYIYHFTVAREGTGDAVTIQLIPNTTDPIISVASTAIDFGDVGMPGSSVSTATITAYNLTAGITATTAAPFSVSADGTTYGATATIAQTGGTLYVKYTPTSVGPANGTVTLASTGATSVTLTLTGNAIDCSNNPLPYNTDFTNEALNNCWTIVDANNDGDPEEGNGMWNFMTEDGWAQYFYHSTNTANDWLISPVFAIPQNGAVASFNYKVRGSSYPEKFSVYVIPANGSYLNAIQISATQTVNNTTFETKYLDLASYAGQSIQIAIKAESDPDMYGLNITNFFIGADLPTTMTVNPTAINFGSLPVGMDVENMVVINSANLNEAINVTTTAPYSVSLNGTNYNTTVTIPANPALSVADTIYVKFAPTAAGSFDGNVIISTSTIIDTVVLTGNAADCSTITTFPFNEDFEETSSTLPCWTVNDANNDGRTFSFTNGAAVYTYSSTNPADDWVISPEITFTGSQLLSIDYHAQSSYYPEKFMVAAINGTAITVLTDTIHVTSTSIETEYVDLSSLNGNYKIGIHCVSDPNQYYLLIDNFTINDLSEASLTVTPDSLEFIGIMGQASTAQEVAIIGLALTNSISVSAPANFEVSADNTTFGPTATIANTGLATEASLYVRINAATAGAHSGNVTLTSGTATATIYVEGNAVDCSGGIASLPFTHDFNDAVVPPLCWGYNDANHMGAITIEEGNYGAAFAAVDYLITPEIHSTLPINLSLDYQTLAGLNNISSSSTFRIGYSTTNDNYGSFTWLTPVVANQIDENFFNYTSLFPAGTKYVAIDVTEIGTFTYGMSSYYNYMIFDNFTLEEVSNPEISASTTSVDFGTVFVNEVSTETVVVASALLTTDITATTTAPFEVSADNTTFGATATIPAAGGNLYVRYAPTAVGTHTGNVTLTSTGATSVTISLTGRAIDCSGAATLPFVEDFEDELEECWLFIDADGDSHNWEMVSSPSMNCHSGEGAIASASYDEVALTPDNWLVTPKINLSTDATLSYWICAQDASYAAEHYGVYISTTDVSTSSFTLLFEETIDANGGAKTPGAYKQKNINLSAYTGQNVYIAFRHFNCTDMFWLNLDDVEIREGVGINDVQESFVSVYPNPANNMINVNATSNISNVEVYTIAGQKVGDFTANSTNTTINTSNLTNGLYLMKIHTDNGVINKKFSVVR